MSTLRTIPLEWLTISVLALGCLVILGYVALLVLRRGQRRLKVKLDRSHTQLRRVLSEVQEQLDSLRKVQADSLAEIRLILARADSRESLPDGVQEATPSALDKKFRVFSLARKGLAPGDISRELKIYRGEAELVLGLQRFSDAETESGQVLVQ